MNTESKELSARSYNPVHGGYPGRISWSIKKKPVSAAGTVKRRTMKYRIWNKKISQIVEAVSMGDAYYQASDSFSGEFNVERLDNWDTEDPRSSSYRWVHIRHILEPIKENYEAELQRRKKQRALFEQRSLFVRHAGTERRSGRRR